MTKIALKGINKVKVKGQFYYYLGRGRGAVRLKGEPGSPEFLESYQAARTPAQVLDKRRLKAWINLYRQEKFGDLAPSTQRVWRRWLDEIEDYFGGLSVQLFDRPQIRRDITKWRDKWKATPRTADLGKQVLSRVLGYLVEQGELSNNPCVAIPNLYHANRADIIWTDDDLAALLKVASPEVGWVARLAVLTGLRQGDLLRLRWDQISDTHILVRTSKSRNRRTAVIDKGEALKELLAEIPRRAPTVLTNSDGLPWKGFGSSWDKAMKRAGLGAKGLHFHDLRGTAATNFYKYGFTSREIADTMGWSHDKVDRIIQRYVSYEEVQRDRIRRIDEGRRRTKMQN
jgi:Phage integrase family.